MENNLEDETRSIDELYKEWTADKRTRGEELQKCGRQVWRAMRQWDQVSTQEHWNGVVVQAKEDLDNGHFLINWLGGQAYLEPEVIATLLLLRKGFTEMYGIKTPGRVHADGHGPDRLLQRSTRPADARGPGYKHRA